jgi:hypothetical protein
MSESHSCSKCGIDARPMLLGNIQPLLPCGQLKGDECLSAHPADCPMADWQQGYVQALKDKLKRKEPAVAEQFPKCKELGLEVRRAEEIWPTITHVEYPNGTKLACPESMVRAADVEALLEKGVRVYGTPDIPAVAWGAKPHMLDTHTALLINVRPIVKDTAEGLLRELVALDDKPLATISADCYSKIIERAKRLLK